MLVLAVRMTSTPTMMRGILLPLGTVSAASPVVACICTPTCASFASRPWLTKLCEALSSTSTVFSRSLMQSPLSDRSGRSTSPRNFGRVVRSLGGDDERAVCTHAATTAREMSVTQYMPALVSLSHIALATAGAFIGADSITDM
eukprot:5430317-Pleurochrysis_carterae.AAC.10